jgi:8-oxo-dGTP pyrophosphatase MutT (NUDIX family)
MSKEISYGCCIYKYTKNGVEILLCRSHSIDTIGFPKGKIEKGEYIKETATREVKEEINIDINPYYLEQYFEQNYKNKLVGIFLINYYNLSSYEFKDSIEVTDIDFVNLYNIDFNKVQENQKRIIEDIMYHFRINFNSYKSLRKFLI